MRYVLNKIFRGGCYVSAAIVIVALGSLYAHKTASAAVLYTFGQQAEPNSLTINQDTGTSSFRSFNFASSGIAEWVHLPTYTGCTQNNFGTITLWNLTEATTTAVSENTPNGIGGQNFTTNPFVNKTDYYTIGIENTNGGGTGNNLCFGTSTTVPLLPQLGITINGTSFETPPASTGTVSLVFPADTALLQEFPAWAVNYAITGTGQFNVRVFAATSSARLNLVSSPAPQIDTLGISSNGSTSDAGVPIPRGGVFCVTTNDCEAPTGTVWYARAEIADSAGSVFATSSIISFNVIFNPGPIVEQNCDSGDFLCKAIRWLFYPSQAVLDRWTGLSTNLKNKPPFGYITSATGALSTLATSTTSTFSLSPDLAGLPFWAPIKAVISFLLYLTGIFWLFNRARHIQL